MKSKHNNSTVKVFLSELNNFFSPEKLKIILFNRSLRNCIRRDEGNFR